MAPNRTAAAAATIHSTQFESLDIRGDLRSSFSGDHRCFCCSSLSKRLRYRDCEARTSNDRRGQKDLSL